MVKIKYFFLLAALLFTVSCSTGDAATAAVGQMAGGSSQALLFLNCRAVSEDEIEFEFSQPVTVKSISFEPVLKIASTEDGSTVKVKLEDKPEPGILFTADILAEDSSRNSINVLIPFRSRNNRMPSLVINELCMDYASSATGKKPEFIELKMKSAGNLGAMRLIIMGNSNTSKLTVYEFLPVEVKKDEYVVLHLRTVEDGCKDEYGKDLNESGGKTASPTARDFWMPGNTKLLHKAASVVYALDQDDKVLDAVMISESPDSWWKKDYFAEAADFLFKQGAWKSAEGQICTPADAVPSGKVTNTRTICRDENIENSNTAADWYTTDTSCTTPGKPNNPQRYLK
jgi:hypothetical protein